MADEIVNRANPLADVDQPAAAIGSIAGLGALFSAAACCVLPLALAAVGVGSGALAAFVPYHWPLTIVAGIAIAIGWVLHIRKRGACANDATCSISAPRRATLVLLSLATLLVLLSVICKVLLEAPLMSWIAGE